MGRLGARTINCSQVPGVHVLGQGKQNHDAKRLFVDDLTQKMRAIPTYQDATQRAHGWYKAKAVIAPRSKLSDKLLIKVFFLCLLETEQVLSSILSCMASHFSTHH